MLRQDQKLLGIVMGYKILAVVMEIPYGITGYHWIHSKFNLFSEIAN